MAYILNQVFTIQLFKYFYFPVFSCIFGGKPRQLQNKFWWQLVNKIVNKVVNPDFWHLSSESKILNFRQVKYLANFNEN